MISILSLQSLIQRKPFKSNKVLMKILYLSEIFKWERTKYHNLIRVNKVSKTFKEEQIISKNPKNRKTKKEQKKLTKII